MLQLLILLFLGSLSVGCLTGAYLASRPWPTAEMFTSWDERKVDEP